jgi:hypothetical protein
VSEEVLYGLMRQNLAAQTSDERVSQWYAAMQGALVALESSHGVYVDEILTAAALVIHARKQGHAGTTFRVPMAHELQAVFDELDQDTKIEPLLSWTAKNINRLSPLVTADPWTHETLTDLMSAKLFAVRERNPLILRAVVQFALAEYLLCGYDLAALYAVFGKLHPLPSGPDE